MYPRNPKNETIVGACLTAYVLSYTLTEIFGYRDFVLIICIAIWVIAIISAIYIIFKYL